MLHDVISRCLNVHGTVASAYLPTPSAEVGAGRTAALRWQDMRRQLARDGADDATLQAMDAAFGVDTEAVTPGVRAEAENRRPSPPADDQADHADGAVLAVIAADGEVLVRRALEHVPAAGSARVSPVPWLTPLIEAEQGRVPYLVVLLDRTGAEIWGVDEDHHAIEAEVEGKDHPIHRVRSGGWSHRRIQQRVVDTWEANAGTVADEVDRLVRKLRPARVLVAGEDHAVSAFFNAASGQLGPLLHKLQRGARHDRTNAEQVEEEVRRLVRTVVAAETVTVLDRFRSRLGHGDQAADGPNEVVCALQIGAVEQLLVHDAADDDRTAVFSDAHGQVALDAAELDALGATDVVRARLIDVCVRAALAQGADVRIMPAAVLDSGLGALLRAPIPRG